MDGDAREIAVYDCLYVFCLQSYGTERVARLFDLSGYIACSLEKCSEREGCACCKDQPVL